MSCIHLPVSSSYLQRCLILSLQLNSLRVLYKISLFPFSHELWPFLPGRDTCCLVSDHDSWSQIKWIIEYPERRAWWGLFILGWASLIFFPKYFLSKCELQYLSGQSRGPSFIHSFYYLSNCAWSGCMWQSVTLLVDTKLFGFKALNQSIQLF